MKRLILLVFFSVMVFLSALVSVSAQSTSKSMTVNGAGASFPFPVYAQWAYKYNQITGTKVNY